MEVKLWDSIDVGSNEPEYPYEILMRYAQLLTKDTDGRITGTITETTVPTKNDQGFEFDRMIYALYLVVPSLRNASYRLIEIEHINFLPYPVNVKLYGQVAPNVISFDNIQGEKELARHLEELIKHPLTKMLIGHIFNMIEIKKSA